MNELGEALKALLARKGLAQRPYAKKAGVALSTVWKAVTAFSSHTDFNPSTLTALAAGLGMTVDEFLESLAAEPVVQRPRPYTVHDVDASRADPLAIAHTIPLKSNVIAGPGRDYQAGIHADKYLPTALVPFPSWRPAAYVVKENSMAPVYQHGDVVVVAEGLKNLLTDDDVIFGFHNGDSTLKRVRVISDEKWELIAMNPPHVYRTVNPFEDLAWFAPVVGHWHPTFARRPIPWDETG